jgi:hypothetical protein
MSKRLAEIRTRKQALIEKAARERIEVAAAFKNLRSPFDLGGMVVGIGRTLKAHPMVAAGLSSLIVSGYARNLLKPAGEFFSLWRLLLPVWKWWKARRRASA